MSDISHAHTPADGAKTEADGVNYRGLIAFLAVLFGTTLLCQALIWVMFGFMDRQAARDDPPPTVVTAPFGEPSDNCVPLPLGGPVGHRPCLTKDGQVASGRPNVGPNLMTDDPLGLKVFREKEDQILDTYGVMDKNAGVYRIPIDRAKKLLLQRGIPGGSPMAPVAAATTTKK